MSVYVGLVSPTISQSAVPVLTKLKEYQFPGSNYSPNPEKRMKLVSARAVHQKHAGKEAAKFYKRIYSLVVSS